MSRPCTMDITDHLNCVCRRRLQEGDLIEVHSGFGRHERITFALVINIPYHVNSTRREWVYGGERGLCWLRRHEWVRIIRRVEGEK